MNNGTDFVAGGVVLSKTELFLKEKPFRFGIELATFHGFTEPGHFYAFVRAQRNLL